jgi:uncharacterized protein YndB with AHSA1/START domain
LVGKWGGGILGRIEQSIEIKAPLEKVWEMLAFDKQLAWMGNVSSGGGWRSAVYTSEVLAPEDKYRVGASAEITEKRGKPYEYKITESVENEKLVFRTPYYNMGIQYALKPTENGTEITFLYDYELPYSVLGRIIAILLVQRQGKRAMQESLQKLKSILED